MSHNIFKKTEMFISLDVTKKVIFKIYTSYRRYISFLLFLIIIQKSISLQ